MAQVTDCISWLAQHRDNMQQKKSFIGRILSSSFDVDLTAFSQSKSAKMFPKPQINFFQGSVATVYCLEGPYKFW